MAGTQNQPLEYEQAGYNAPDGLLVGRLSTDKVGFFGTAPVIRVTTGLTNISTTASISLAGVYGFATSTETLQVTLAVSNMVSAMKVYGLL